VLIDLSTGQYTVDETGRVLGVEAIRPTG